MDILAGIARPLVTREASRPNHLAPPASRPTLAGTLYILRQ